MRQFRLLLNQSLSPHQPAQRFLGSALRRSHDESRSRRLNEKAMLLRFEWHALVREPLADHIAKKKKKLAEMSIHLACRGAGNPRWSIPLHPSIALPACVRLARDHQNDEIPAQQRQCQSWRILGQKMRLDSDHLGHTGSLDMRASQKGQAPIKLRVSAASLERWFCLLLTWFSACLLYTATCMLSALFKENPPITTHHICWQINAHTLSCIRSKSLHYSWVRGLFKGT